MHLHCDRIFHCSTRMSEEERGALHVWDTMSRFSTRRPSVTSLVRVGTEGVTRKDLVSSWGLFSPRIILQWYIKSGMESPFGTCTASSWQSTLLILGAELNEPILVEDNKIRVGVLAMCGLSSSWYHK